MSEGQRRKRAGMEAALSGSDWAEDALDALRRFSREHKLFTAEQFRYAWLDAGGEMPRTHNCWGALFSKARSRGLIRHTGTYRHAVSARTHGHPVGVWQRVTE